MRRTFIFVGILFLIVGVFLLMPRLLFLGFFPNFSSKLPKLPIFSFVLIFVGVIMIIFGIIFKSSKNEDNGFNMNY